MENNSDKDNISNEEKIRLTEQGLTSLYEEFGQNDEIKLIFMDVLFEELYKNNISLLS